MYPSKFDYHRPSSVQEAVQILSDNPDAKVLAGGHSLIPVMKLRLAAPAALVDIGRIDALQGISRSNGSLRIGACVTYNEIANSADVQAAAPLLAEAAGQIGDRQVRYRGTIGGNLSHADPASDLPAAALALGATLHVTGTGGSRSVSASDFFVDLMMTALQPDEILTEVEIPATAAGTGSAYVKFEHPASGYALCGAAALVSRGDGGSCTGASLCFNGVSSTAVSASGVASGLVGSDLSDDAIVSAVSGLSIPDATGDMFASAGYRQELAKSIGIQALLTARDRA
ncbi:MAG: xanthine dehydrogenase family protein subunit M [Caldilineaceae bacterium SB0668_bin_21]|nr:xanthine dehydrogenase family protein subunit M [Caldilineaceae bacterium SB0668_bin_21]MYC23480.1 xanthine dehydrogenase family protein subunit M [Caldilineaceae bacterium SB0662_bin_25]